MGYERLTLSRTNLQTLVARVRALGALDCRLILASSRLGARDKWPIIEKVAAFADYSMKILVPSPLDGEIAVEIKASNGGPYAFLAGDTVMCSQSMIWGTRQTPSVAFGLAVASPSAWHDELARARFPSFETGPKNKVSLQKLDKIGTFITEFCGSAAILLSVAIAQRGIQRELSVWVLDDSERKVEIRKSGIVLSLGGKELVLRVGDPAFFGENTILWNTTLDHRCVAYRLDRV